MKLLLFMTDFIVPLVIFGIISYGILMEVNVYDTFIKGAKSGFFTVIKIMPTLVGLMVAVGILRASGFFVPPHRCFVHSKFHDQSPLILYCTPSFRTQVLSPL